jgi:hypothetical protein
MNNTNREGRYTGPSLQANGVVIKNKSQKTHYVVVPAPAKMTRAEQAAARDAAAIADLRKEGGIVAFGAWQTGTGNYKKARAIPEGAVVWKKMDCESRNAEFGMPARLPKAPAHVCKWFADHPRAQRCVAIQTN